MTGPGAPPAGPPSPTHPSNHTPRLPQSSSTPWSTTTWCVEGLPSLSCCMLLGKRTPPPPSAPRQPAACLRKRGIDRLCCLCCLCCLPLLAACPSAEAQRLPLEGLLRGQRGGRLQPRQGGPACSQVLQPAAAGAVPCLLLRRRQAAVGVADASATDSHASREAVLCCSEARRQGPGCAGAGDRLPTCRAPPLPRRRCCSRARPRWWSCWARSEPQAPRKQQMQQAAAAADECGAGRTPRRVSQPCPLPCACKRRP